MSAGALLTLRITPDEGEPFVVKVFTRDVLIWEKTGQKRSYAELMRQQDMVPLYQVAHIAARRAGQFTEDLTTFERTCDLEPVEVDSDEDPTSPVP